MALNGSINMFASLGKLNEKDIEVNEEKKSSEKKPAAKPEVKKETANKPEVKQGTEKKPSGKPAAEVKKTNSSKKTEVNLNDKVFGDNERGVGRPVANTVTFTTRLAIDQPKKLKIMAATTDFGSVSNIVQAGVEIMTTLGEEKYMELEALAKMKGVTAAELVTKAVEQYIK